MNRRIAAWLLTILVSLLPGSTPATAHPNEAGATPPSSAPRLQGRAGNDRVVLEWTPVATARAYQIFRAVDGVWSTDPLIRIHGLVFRDHRVDNGIRYDYKVVPVNRAGAGPVSNIVSVMPLAPPEGLSAESGNAQVRLNWRPSTGATAYAVYRGPSWAYESMTRIATGLTSPTYLDTNLTNGTVYFYRVRASAALNESRPSQPARGKPMVPPPSTAPGGLAASVSNSKVTLTWTAVAGATGYKIFRSTNNATWTLPAIGSTQRTEFVDRNVTSGTTYFYKVAAFNRSGMGPLSEAVSSTPTTAPSAPTGVTATAGNAAVTLTWTPVTGATSYNVYRRTASGAQASTPVASNLTTSAYVDSGLTNGVTYFYRVTAVGAGGQSARSAEVSATPVAPTPPAAPAGVTATAGNTTISLSWGAVAGATSYTVYRGSASGAVGTTPLVTGLLTPGFADTGLTNGLTYFYQVTAVGSGGESARSAEVSGTPVAPPVVDPVADAYRFLKQATWGPKPGDVEALQSSSKDAFIAQQFSAAMSQYPDALYDQSIEAAQEHFMSLTLSGQDQLRQRMAWALHKIWVVSGVEVTSVRGIVAYHRLLVAGAFGNYRDLMRTITLNPAMGRYLNMLNNRSQAVTGVLPNENYARELMQLFTLGLTRLNPDGTPMLDSSGRPIPSYTEDDVKALARILTGWTFGDGNPASVPTSGGATNYLVPMEPVAAWHDTTAKTFLGEAFPAGTPAAVELDHALDVILAQPSIAPFISRQLIQQLVTSNPSPAYVADIAAVFEGAGGVKGDLAATVRAILLHPEASLVTGGSGKLAEPVLYLTSMMRALNASVSDHPFLTDRAETMGQRVFYPPSVFSYFSPSFRVRGTTSPAGGELAGPEFQGLTTVTALERANFVGQLLGGWFGTNVTIDYSPFTTRAADAGTLVDFCNLTFMGGRMSSQQRTEIMRAVNVTPSTNPTERARTAIYLTLTSAQSQVDR